MNFMYASNHIPLYRLKASSFFVPLPTRALVMVMASHERRVPAESPHMQAMKEMTAKKTPLASFYAHNSPSLSLECSLHEKASPPRSGANFWRPLLFMHAFSLVHPIPPNFSPPKRPVHIYSSPAFPELFRPPRVHPG